MILPHKGVQATPFNGIWVCSRVDMEILGSIFSPGSDLDEVKENAFRALSFCTGGEENPLPRTAPYKRLLENSPPCGLMVFRDLIGHLLRRRPS